MLVQVSDYVAVRELVTLGLPRKSLLELRERADLHASSVMGLELQMTSDMRAMLMQAAKATGNKVCLVRLHPPCAAQTLRTL